MGEKFASADKQIVHTLPPSSLIPSSEWVMESLGEGSLAASMGYEQLLSIQQQQHALELQQKDAELAHLKACLEFEANRNTARTSKNDEGLSAALRTQEEATTILMAAKHKELELMVGLLQLREQQIDDFRQLCEVQKIEIQQLKRRRSSVAEFGGPNESMGSSLETVRTPEVPNTSPGTIVAASEGNALQLDANRDKEENQQTQREVRRLRLRMEELEAAMGEQHDRNAGLARELETKIEKVKALEEQVRVLRSPAFDDLHFQSFRAQGNSFQGLVSPGSDVGRPGGEMSPGFGTFSGAASGSVHLSSHGYENRGSHVSNAISTDSLDHTRFGSYVHNQYDHRQHGGHGLRRMHHRSMSSGQNLPMTNGVTSVSSPSLALPPLQSGSAVSAAMSTTPAMRLTPVPVATTNDEPGVAEAAAAYFLARSNERRPHTENEVVAGRSPLRLESPRHTSPRQSPVRTPVPVQVTSSVREGTTNVVVTRVYSEREQVPGNHQASSLTVPSSARVNTSSPSTLDAMALRRLGDEGHRHSQTPEPQGHRQTVVEGDVTQSFMSVSGQSQAPSYHSALRVEPAESNLPRTERSPYGTSPVPNGTSETPGETGRQSQELLQEMRRLRLQMSELERVAGSRQKSEVIGVRHRTHRHRKGSEHVGASGSSHNGENSGPGSGAESSPVRGRASKSSSSTMAKQEPDSFSWLWPQESGTNRSGVFTPVSVTTVSSQVRSARSEQQTGPEFAGWEYRPHASGDPVDAAVASLVNRPGRYRGWRALLCRLDQGIYLCGTRRVHLRADLAQQTIEASDDGGNTWSDLEVIMKGAEASQRALLERAREAVGIAA